MAASERFFRKGQYLFKEGEASNCMYLLRSGSVSIRKMKGSAFVEIARVYSNEVIGELSFFDRQPRSAAAVALTDVTALEIDFSSLEKIYKNVPDYVKSIMSAVADRLRKADETIRRLQKHMVMEEGAKGGEHGEIDTASVLEATIDPTANSEPKKE